MKTKNKTMAWEKEFDEGGLLWTDAGKLCGAYPCLERLKEQKQFIAQEIRKAKEEAYDLGAEESNFVCNEKTIPLVRKDLLKKIKLKKVKVLKSHKGKSWCPQCEDVGYNHAIDDLEKLKKSL